LADLAEAIEADQLFLEYQLIFDCGLARMTGAEALLRWRHPMLGIIPPDQFIPLARGDPSDPSIDRLGRHGGDEADGRLECPKTRRSTSPSTSRRKIWRILISPIACISAVWTLASIAHC